MRVKKILLSALLTASLGACAATGKGPADRVSPFKSGELTNMLAGVKDQRLNDKFIRGGLKNLEKGDYVAANKAFGRALKFEPTDPNLHFLNGLAYQLRAEDGDSSQNGMASVAYNLALKYDSSNYWAAYLLGQISYKEQRYREAQDAFAYALLFAPENPTILKALAAASYRAQDLETAMSATAKAAKLAPKDANILYNRVLLSSAAGRFKEAASALAVYNKAAGGAKAFRASYLTARIGDWKRFYNSKPYLRLAQSTSDIFGSDNSSSDDQDSDTSDDSGDDSINDSDSNSSNSSNDNSSDSSSAADKPAIPRMVLVDVIIIRSEDRFSTSKGVNLLNGLSAVLGGTISYNGVRTINFNAANTNARTFTTNPTFTLAATYALNIFSDDYDQNQVLARPTLVAMDGSTSNFFSGAVWHVELTGSAGGEGTVSEIPVGVKLDITPDFISNDMVKLQVSASRAYIETVATSPTFSAFAQTTDTKVNVNVAIKFGDTLVLSGLNEKETENLRNGVPFLQNIPGIQYLFSNEATLKTNKSVLILITPRRPRYTYEDGTTKVDPLNPPDAKAAQPNLTELKGRDDWFKPAPNVDSVFWHLKDMTYFKEFRNGDVRMEKWDYPETVGDMIGRAVRFLYF